MKSSFKLEKIEDLSYFFSEDTIYSNIDKKDIIEVNGKDCISESSYHSLGLKVMSKGYLESRVLTYEELIHTLKRRGLITNNTLVEQLFKGGYLRKYLVKLPFSTKKVYKITILDSIENAILNGGIVTLALENSITIKVLIEKTGLKFNDIINTIKILNLDVTTFVNIMLFSEENVKSIEEYHNIKDSKDEKIKIVGNSKEYYFENENNSYSEEEPLIFTIEEEKYIYSKNVKLYIERNGLKLKDLQYLFNNGVLEYYQKDYLGYSIPVTKKEYLDLFIEYYKLTKTRISINNAKSILSYYMNTNSIKESIFSLNNSIPISDLLNVVSEHYMTFKKMNEPKKKEYIVKYLNRVGFKISYYDESIRVPLLYKEKLEDTLVTGTLHIKEDNCISSLVLHKILDVKSKYLVEREKSNNNVIEYDNLPEKYFVISKLPISEQNIIVEYLNSKKKQDREVEIDV